MNDHPNSNLNLQQFSKYNTNIEPDLQLFREIQQNHNPHISIYIDMSKQDQVWTAAIIKQQNISDWLSENTNTYM